MKTLLLCASFALAVLCPARTVKAARVTLQSVTVSPTSPSIAISASQQFTATAHYSNGTTTDVTSSAAWTSSNASIATVSGGLAQGISAGSSTIKATYSAKSGSTVLTVNPNPPPPGTTVINFDAPGCPNGNASNALTGSWQGIDWGSSPWDCEVVGSPTDTTTSASWSVNQTAATFSFLVPSVLNSLKAATAGASGTVTLSSDQNETISSALAANAGMLLINTGFVHPATLVTVSFTGGWTIEVDDLTYTTPPVSQCNPHSVILTWTDPDSVTFKVYRSGASGGPYFPIAGGLTTTNYQDSNTPAGNYYYVVTAVDGTGAESVYSAQTSAVVPCQ